MLELDAWLSGYLDTRYPVASPRLQADFAALLAQDDMALFDWLTGEGVPPESLRAVVEAIRTYRITT